MPTHTCLVWGGWDYFNGPYWLILLGWVTRLVCKWSVQKPVSSPYTGWLRTDFPQWIVIIPSLLGSITPYNHQPTRVLNIARFYPNYIALIYILYYLGLEQFFWSTTLASYNFSSLGLGQAPAPLPSPGRHQGKPSILHYLVVYLLIVVPQQPFNNLLCSFVYVCKATQRCRVETCQYLQSWACSFGAKASFAIFLGAIFVHSAGAH